jgi:hypothetical protein
MLLSAIYAGFRAFGHSLSSFLIPPGVPTKSPTVNRGAKLPKTLSGPGEYTVLEEAVEAVDNPEAGGARIGLAKLLLGVEILITSCFAATCWKDDDEVRSCHRHLVI